MKLLTRFLNLFRKPWAVILDTYQESGETVALLDCGHEVCIDSRTPRFVCPLCAARRYQV